MWGRAWCIQMSLHFLPFFLHCRWVVCERQLFSWLHRIIWTWISICILFKLPVGGLWLPPNFAFVFCLSFFSFISVLQLLFRLSSFLLVIIEIFLFSVFIHVKQGSERLSRHLYQTTGRLSFPPLCMCLHVHNYSVGARSPVICDICVCGRVCLYLWLSACTWM